MCVYIFQPTCLLTMSSCIFGFALWASMLLLACRIHMSVDDWYGYLLVDRFHCKLSISKLHILVLDVWSAHMGFDGCSTQQSIMLHEYPCFLVKMHQMPHVWTICDWSYCLLWRRNAAKVSCNSYSTIIAKKQWKSTPPVLICGFTSNGISMITAMAVGNSEVEITKWDYVLIVEAPSLTTRIGWYQEMFGLAQRKRPVFKLFWIWMLKGVHVHLIQSPNT